MDAQADRPGPVERWFRGDGIRIHALDWGGPAHAPAALMLHGVGGNAWIWDGVARRLARLLPGHRIVAIDQRDGGDTEHPPTGYSRERFVADVAAVHDQLGGGPMALIGHSRGGWLASAFAATYPDRLSRLVLVDPARLVFEREADADAFFSWVSGSLGPFESEEAALTWATAQDPHADWTPIRTRSFLAGLRRDEAGRLVGKLPSEAVPQLRQARVDGEVVTEGLSAIETPTLLLVAERQSAARLRDKLAYAERIPEVTVRRLDGSHFLHAETPADVAAEIASFIAADRPGREGRCEGPR